MSDEVEVLEPNVAALAVRNTDATLVLPAAGGEALVRAFKAYQETCEALLDDSDYQTIKERGKESRFRKRSGWRKLAIAYAVTFEIVDHKIYPDPNEGPPEYAEFTVRATAPNGRFADGWGACSLDERCCDQGCAKTFWKDGQKVEHDHCPAARGDKCPPKKHFSKPRHDIPATAETRAKNRAAADLFGMGEVSAEEVGGQAADRDEPPAVDSGFKCPHCGAAVEDRRADPGTRPLWACTNSDCGGGGKKKTGGGNWPWGSYDPDFFDATREGDQDGELAVSHGSGEVPAVTGGFDVPAPMEGAELWDELLRALSEGAGVGDRGKVEARTRNLARLMEVNGLWPAGSLAALLARWKGLGLVEWHDLGQRAAMVEFAQAVADKANEKVTETMRAEGTPR